VKFKLISVKLGLSN